MALGSKFQTMGPLYLALFLPRSLLHRTYGKSLSAMSYIRKVIKQCRTYGKSLSAMSFGAIFVLFPHVVSDCRSLMSLDSLVKVSARVTNITCIAQATLKMILSASLIHKGWLVFPHFYFVLDLPTCVHRADIHIDLSTEPSKLSAHCVCRFLIFERQHDSGWGFLLLKYLLLGA